MKNLFTFAALLFLLIPIHGFCSEAEQPVRPAADSIIPDLCDGTHPVAASPRASAEMLMNLLVLENWDHLRARGENLLERTIDSEQYRLTKVLLRKFPELFMQNGRLLDSAIIKRILGDKLYRALVDHYTASVAQEFLRLEAKYMKRWPNDSRGPFASWQRPSPNQQPQYQYYYELSHMREWLYRISLQRGLDMNEFLKRQRPSKLKASAPVFAPQPKKVVPPRPRNFEKENAPMAIINLLKGLNITGPITCNPQPVILHRYLPYGYRSPLILMPKQ